MLEERHADRIIWWWICPGHYKKNLIPLRPKSNRLIRNKYHKGHSSVKSANRVSQAPYWVFQHFKFALAKIVEDWGPWESQNVTLEDWQPTTEFGDGWYRLCEEVLELRCGKRNLVWLLESQKSELTNWMYPTIQA